VTAGELAFGDRREEEIGSANLGPFLSENRDALKCDVAVVSDTGMLSAVRAQP